MAPNATSDLVTEQESFVAPEKKPYRRELIWSNIIGISLFHVIGLYGLIVAPILAKWQSVVWSFFLGGAGGFGVTGGVHRFWTHRSYKAKLPLRIILAICYSIAGQNTIFDWVRDHRVHHKYSETDADPHNANRGFFFAHVGWLMMKKHPEVIRKGRQIDMSDVTSDPVVAFHQRYFTPLKILFCFVIPIAVPVYFWDEQLKISILGCLARYACGLNFTWLVNSAAHIWGNKPYDRRISPTQNRMVSIVAMGEGWHNYHHAFPYDYRAAELGLSKVNVTLFWLNLFSKIGWAYDLRQPSAEAVRNQALRHGDGTHPKHGHSY